MSVSQSLPALMKDASQIALLLAESDGEITPEIEVLLDQNSQGLQSKMDGYWFVFSELVAREQYAGTRAEEWDRAAKACAKASQNLRERLLHAMKQLDVPELSGAEVTWRRQANPPSCVIEDQSKIPGEFITVETPPPVTKVNKKGILEALKAGKEVPGARMERGERVVPRVASTVKIGRGA